MKNEELRNFVIRLRKEAEEIRRLGASAPDAEKKETFDRLADNLLFLAAQIERRFLDAEKPTAH